VFRNAEDVDAAVRILQEDIERDRNVESDSEDETLANITV
jgi:hypothetical protein